MSETVEPAWIPAAGEPVRTFSEPQVVVEPRPGGDWVVRSPRPLPPHEPLITRHLFRWAEQAPDRPFLRRRDPAGGWRGVSYAEAAATVRRIAGALLRLGLGLGPDRPVAVLSGNAIEHALLGLAAQSVGIPYAAVSPPYSLADPEMGKLRHVLAKLTPGLIHVDSAAPFARALALEEARDALVYATDPAGVERARPFAALLDGPEDDGAVGRAMAAVDPDAPAKLLFTSGSTGMPKGVIATHRMMAANQEQIAEAWTFLRQEPPVLLDWLPWNHVFGNSKNLNMVIRHGGTLWIDDGRPIPGEFERTLENLREVSPTISFNVPKGYELLIPRLEADAALARSFFARLRLMFYAGAALPPPLWRRLEALAATHGAQGGVHMVSSWGLTETAPAILMAHAAGAAVGCIGTPLPGVELRLVPEGDKLEARVRGPNITPGYWREPEATAAAFDEDGWFRTGDALRWVDPAHPEQGFLFDGRLTEDFKLSTGTRVNAGAVKIRALAALAGAVRDLLVVGENREEIGLLLVPHEHHRAELRDPDTAAALGREVGRALHAMNEGEPSSRRIGRALFLVEPPSLAKGEITDKGSLNARAILRHRPEVLAALYGDADPAVIRP
ncbi:feruloyl-CoA synthase [Roseomonas sp. OT10]|uniref:feruloyl-CoA synthase n=1 Tax=Roseomonas cutis TaxID=2897332 RepID=UPI001E5AA598|nr:feruloyl-CoA synthase [Roseomonas sp. OT10]UFN47146.1 feruloyl-CoA synthase [Roseomonas sp. OT10]